jgi:hypothetical protein
MRNVFGNSPSPQTLKEPKVTRCVVLIVADAAVEGLVLFLILHNLPEKRVASRFFGQIKSGD